MDHLFVAVNLKKIECIPLLLLYNNILARFAPIESLQMVRTLNSDVYIVLHTLFTRYMVLLVTCKCCRAKIGRNNRPQIVMIDGFLM